MPLMMPLYERYELLTITPPLEIRHCHNIFRQDAAQSRLATPYVIAITPTLAIYATPRHYYGTFPVY